MERDPSHSSADGHIPPVPMQQMPPHMGYPEPSFSPQIAQNENSRPPRPSISVQVPERAGGAVRLATPQPPAAGEPDALPTYDNMHRPQPGQPQPHADNAKSQKWDPISATADAYTASGEEPGENIPEYFFETMKDRTNVDALMAYFIRVTHESDWYDEEGKPTEPASMEEATAIINSTLENMYKTATSSQAFLINLAALAGARMLMTTLTRCVRVGEKEDHTAYRCEWEYRFGHLHGYFNMAAAVPFSMWRAKKDAGGPDAQAMASAAAGSHAEPEPTNPRLRAEHWQNKYQSLLGQVDKMDKELFELRNKVMDSLKPGREP